MAERLPSSQSDEIQPYDSDHTALVHVLWSAGINGAEADELASKIMQSKWLRAVRLHAAPRNTVQLPDADTL
jgi:hypothetical protein